MLMLVNNAIIMCCLHGLRCINKSHRAVCICLLLRSCENELSGFSLFASGAAHSGIGGQPHQHQSYGLPERDVRVHWEEHNDGWINGIYLLSLQWLCVADVSCALC